MLSHVQYSNSNFTKIEKIKILSRHTNVKNKIALNIVCYKKYTIPYSNLFWSVYTNSVCTLKLNKIYKFTRIEKNLNII